MSVVTVKRTEKLGIDDFACFAKAVGGAETPRDLTAFR